MRALKCNVYKHGDHSNHGISERYDEVLVICPDGPVEVDPKDPLENLVKVVKRNLFGRQYVHIEPYALANGVGWMYGGSIIDASDSRFYELTGVDYPIHFHDRTESQKMYDMLSR